MKKLLFNLFDFVRKRINSPPLYIWFSKMFLLKHERIYGDSVVEFNFHRVKNKKISHMKTSILTFVLVLISIMSFSQQATIDGDVCASAPDCPKYVCENSTIDLTAGITSGAVDSVVWRERVWDGSSWSTYQTIGTTVTIGVPVTEPATVGHSYRYQLIVYQGGIMYYALADMYVNSAPSPTLLSDYTTICDGAMVNFTASAGGTNYDFQINGISAQNGASSNFSSSSLADGDQVTVVVTNAGGCFATSNIINITVNPLPSLTSVTGNVGSPGCVGELVNIDITGLTGTGPWDLEVYNDASGSPSTLYYDAGSVATFDATITVPVDNVGFDTKHLRITDSNGCSNF